MSAEDNVRIEIQAKQNALACIKNLFQDPKQLDRLDQLRIRNSQSLKNVESNLKNFIQSYASDIRTATDLLESCKKDYNEVVDCVDSIQKQLNAALSTSPEFDKLAEENKEYEKLNSAVSNAEIINKASTMFENARGLIKSDKFLHAHTILLELENCGLNLVSEGAVDHKLLKFFEDLDNMVEELFGSLKVSLRRMVLHLRRAPASIVTAVRIIERECKIDFNFEELYQHTKFRPQGRPKGLRQRFFDVILENITERVEGCQLDDKSDKIWILKYLETLVNVTKDDLIVIQAYAIQCFPKNYNILETYCQYYHNVLCNRLGDLVKEVHGQQLLPFINWIDKALTPYFFVDVKVRMNFASFGPLISQEVMDGLLTSFLSYYATDISTCMTKGLDHDQADWRSSNEPETNSSDKFQTSLYFSIMALLEQRLQLISTLEKYSIIKRSVELSMNSLNTFILNYKREINSLIQAHVQNRSVPPMYTFYVIANCNNLALMTPSIKKLAIKFLQLDFENSPSEQKFMTFQSNCLPLVSQCIQALFDEMLLDLAKFLRELCTDKWLTNRNTNNISEIVCVTIEDYCQHYSKLCDEQYRALLEKLREHILLAYVEALCSKKINWKNRSVRAEAAELIEADAARFQGVFEQLLKSEYQTSAPPFHFLVDVVKLLKQEDRSMMFIEIAEFIGKYEEINPDQVVNLVAIRDDFNKSAVRDICVDAFKEDFHQKPKSATGFFSLIL